MVDTQESGTSPHRAVSETAWAQRIDAVDTRQPGVNPHRAVSETVPANRLIWLIQDDPGHGLTKNGHFIALSPKEL